MELNLTVQFSSVTQLCLTDCDPMDCSTPGFPVHHQLPELAQTHVHWVSYAIQQSHPLSSPSPLAFNLSQHQGLSNESALRIRWPKYWSFSFNISPSSEYSVYVMAIEQLQVYLVHICLCQVPCPEDWFLGPLRNPEMTMLKQLQDLLCGRLMISAHGKSWSFVC